MKLGTSMTYDGYSLYVDFNIILGSPERITNDPDDSRDEEPDIIEIEAIHITSPANITEIVSSEFMKKIETEIREDPSLRGL